MHEVKGEVTPGTIFCKDGTVRVIKGYLRNYTEAGRAIEGDNYRSSTIDGKEKNRFEEVKPVKAKRTQEEYKSLKAEKTAFKQYMKLKYPHLAEKGLTSDQIWEQVCVKSGSAS